MADPTKKVTFVTSLSLAITTYRLIQMIPGFS